MTNPFKKSNRRRKSRRPWRELSPAYWYVRMPSTQGAPAEKLLLDEASDGSFVLMPCRAEEVSYALPHIKTRSAYAAVNVDLDKTHLLPPPLWPVKDRPELRPMPEIATALNAREALADDKVERGPGLTQLNTDLLVAHVLTKVLVLRSSDRWQQAASDALMGDWVAPLTKEGRLTPLALRTLKADTIAIHRQLVPLWQRGTRQGRTLSLDSSLGKGFSLYDLLANRPSAMELAADSEPDAPRLATLLCALTLDERRVVRAWAYRGIATWADAAWYAGATEAEAEAVGDRVRRKVKRLVAEQRRRRIESGGLWLPDANERRV
ncbi:hypothetical protein [Nonomuraea glycinis]|uniref:hypothetical protein n=1 Tax=Nonomuraea glycinis TaxID=2047744 RepID=UPI002E0FAA16|nr:hypothetical protein OHA68_20905 [Nonomuraea glycinis]